jgi:hypothetical protein
VRSGIKHVQRLALTTITEIEVRSAAPADSPGYVLKGGREYTAPPGDVVVIRRRSGESMVLPVVDPQGFAETPCPRQASELERAFAHQHMNSCQIPLILATPALGSRLVVQATAVILPKYGRDHKLVSRRFDAD